MCPKPETRATVPSVTDLEPLEQLTLALVRLTAWRGDPLDRQDGLSPIRSWRGYSFKALRRLSDAGLLVDKPGARTLELSNEGCAAADGLLNDLGVTPPEIPVRPLPARPATDPAAARVA
jgi:hypothetical protein